MLNLLPVQSNDYLALDPNEQMSYEKPKAEYWSTAANTVTSGPKCKSQSTENNLTIQYKPLKMSQWDTIIHIFNTKMKYLTERNAPAGTMIILILSKLTNVSWELCPT